MIVRPTLPETPNYTTPRGTTPRYMIAARRVRNFDVGTICGVPPRGSSDGTMAGQRSRDRRPDTYRNICTPQQLMRRSSRKRSLGFSSLTPASSVSDPVHYSRFRRRSLKRI
jgi:hypothetical protein